MLYFRLVCMLFYNISVLLLAEFSVVFWYFQCGRSLSSKIESLEYPGISTFACINADVLDRKVNTPLAILRFCSLCFPAISPGTLMIYFGHGGLIQWQLYVVHCLTFLYNTCMTPLLSGLSWAPVGIRIEWVDALVCNSMTWHAASSSAVLSWQCCIAAWELNLPHCWGGRFGEEVEGMRLSSSPLHFNELPSPVVAWVSVLYVLMLCGGSFPTERLASDSAFPALQRPMTL